MAACTLIAAMSVAFVGVISFVGLIAPHMVRRFTGSDYRFLIPGSALGRQHSAAAGGLGIKKRPLPHRAAHRSHYLFPGAPLFLWMLFKGRERL